MSLADRELDERFAGDSLDPEIWFPYYLPHWSSRSESAATSSIERDGLHLRIPANQPLWCPDLHEEPIRVSCVQTGSFSGPVGSTIGQQPFKEGLVVREEQPAMWGYMPHHGRIEVRMRGMVTTRSMFAFWMSGIEDESERSGEICVAEIFGAGIGDHAAEIGAGVRRFRDPALTGRFSVHEVGIDVAEFHTYAVDWRPGRVAFSIDGEVIEALDEAPDYPLQLMIGVFDFPARAERRDDGSVPELIVSHVRGRPPA